MQLDSTPGAQDTKERSNSVRDTLIQAHRLLVLGRPPPWTLAAIPATIILSASLSVVPPLLIGNMIDALQHRDSTATIHQLLLYVATTAAFGLIGLAAGYSSSVFRENLTRNLQLSLVAKLNRARFDALSRLTFGQVTNRSIGDPRAICTQLESSLFPTFSNLCLLTATTFAMLRLDYRLALVALFFSLLIFVPLRISRPHLAALQKRIASAGDEFFGAVADSGSLAALAMFRNPAAAEQKQRRLEDITRRLLRMRVSTVFLGGLTGIASSLSSTLGPGAVMALGAYLAVHGQISAGTIVSLLIYQSRMSGPIGGLSGLQMLLLTMGITTRRIFEIADLPEERSGVVEFVPGDIAVSGLCANHGDREILHDISLTIVRGSHVAFVGPSGAGKSSLVQLLSRLNEPTKGSIQIGGVELCDFTVESLRTGVCLVPQDPFILDGTLLENLTVANPSAEGAEIERSLALAGLAGVVARLPDGLNTTLGQRGFRLSGGERQRVCLARALLQRPEVLVLDEALTGVDVELEREIIAQIRAHLAGKTLVVITHRHGSIADFDKVITIDDGVALPGDVAVTPRRAKSA